MESQEIINVIKQTLNKTKEQGEKVVTLDALDSYLDGLKESITKNEKVDIKLSDYEHERGLAHYDAIQAQNREMLRATITYSQAALKSIIIINGGAAAAILAFIGNVWSVSISATTASGLTNSILLFGFGLLSASLGTAFTYLTQYCYMEERKEWGSGLHITTLVLVLISFVLFGFGLHEAYSGFFDHFNTSQ